MGIHIDINLKFKSKDISLPFSNKILLNLNYKPIVYNWTVGISDFPKFNKIFPNENLVIITNNVSINLISKRLVVDTDPLAIVEIDSMTLNDVDISQNKIINDV